MIAPAIFKPGHVSSVRKVKTALMGSPGEWKKMQGFFMQHFLQKSSDTGGDIVGTRILNNISGKPGSFGMPLMKEVLSEPQIKALTTMGEALKRTQARQAEGAGKVLIQLTQAGAFGAILTQGLSIPATTIILGPAILSKMMLNPTAARLLTQGLKMSPYAPEAAGIMTRLMAASWRANMGTEGDYDEKNK